MKWIHKYARILGCAAVALLFFYKSLVSGLIPFPGDLLISSYKPWSTYSYLGYNPGSYPTKDQYFDTIRQLYPWRTEVTRLIKNKTVPLWNPYNFSGSPLLANIQSAVFYPLSLIYLVFSQPTAWTILVILQPLLSSLFMYLFGRSVGLSRSGAFLSAVSYGYCLYMSVFLEYNSLGHVMIWLPLALLSIEMIKKQKPAGFILYPLTIAITITAGHLQLFGLLLGFSVVYAVWRLRHTVRSLAFVIVFTLFGVGLGAIQLIPTFELIGLSARASQPYEFLIEKLLIQPTQLLLFIAPDIFGNPATRNYLIPDTYPGNALYIGVIPFLFALIGIWKFKTNTLIRGFYIASGILLLFMVNHPVTRLFYRLNIPLVSTSSPTNAIFLLSFCLTLLSGFGVDHIRHITIKRFVITISGVLAVSAVLLAATFLLHIPISYKNLLYSLVVASSGIAFLWFMRHKNRNLRSAALALVCIITIVDLFYFFHKFNSFIPKSLVFPDAEVFTWIQNNAGANRFWGYGSAAIEANFATQYQIFSPDGYDPLYPIHYGQFLGSSRDGKLTRAFTNQTRSDAVLAPGYGERDLPDNPHRLKIMNLLGVKYVLDRVENGGTQVTFPIDRFRRVYEDNGWIIYENLASLPRAFMVSDFRVAATQEEFDQVFFDQSFDPQKTVILEHALPYDIPDASRGNAEIISYEPNTVRITTDAPADQILVLTDTYFPGWHAEIDGNETPVYKADYTLRAIMIPEGKHAVVFRYEPESFSLGVKITIISLVLLAASWIVLFRTYRT